MDQKNRISILSIFKKIYFFKKTELMYCTDFQFLISIILSAQSRDKQVNRVTQVLFQKIKNSKDVLNLGEKKIQKIISSLGLWRKKSYYIVKTSYILLNKFNDRIPNSKKNLLSLPGVGTKTANLFLNTIFKKKYIAVDTHVFRVCIRTGFVLGKTVSEIEQKLIEVVPNKFKLYFHNWFVAHGRYICVSRKPKCYICHIKNICKYYNN